MLLALELLAMLAPRQAEATMIQVTVVLVLLAPLVLLRLVLLVQALVLLVLLPPMVLLAPLVPDNRSHETS